MLIYLLDFYLKIFDLNVLNCLALQHFEFKEDNWKNFSLVFFYFICCMRERKNLFNNENEVITVSCFFLENYFHDKKLQLYIMHLMAIKIKCVYCLAHYLIFQVMAS